MVPKPDPEGVKDIVYDWRSAKPNAKRRKNYNFIYSNKDLFSQKGSCKAEFYADHGSPIFAINLPEQGFLYG